MKTARTLFCGLLLLAMAGCADLRIGTNFNPAMSQELQPNLTTRGQVRGLLGPPVRTHTVGDVTLDVHKYVNGNQFACVYVSYRDDKVMHVTKLR